MASEDMSFDEIDAAFRLLDVNGDGYITLKELKKVMATCSTIKLTNDEMKAMIRAADVDGDGKVNYVEFVKMMKMANK